MPEFSDILPYRKLELGKDYWIKDHMLPDPDRAARRCFQNTEWIQGAPWRPEPWPGWRSPYGLNAQELRHVEEWVQAQLQVSSLRAQGVPEQGVSGHNHAQLVGGAHAVSRPHVDSSDICDYAAVLYLHPCPPTIHSGTSFFRLKLPDGTLGGNTCPKPYQSLSQIPGLQQSDMSMWVEDLEVTNVFNRLILYKSDIIHSATSYFGWDEEIYSKRLTVVLFWKTE